MLAPFATLVFLATFWLVAKIAFDMFAESGDKIVAALLGRPTQPEITTPIIPLRMSRRRVAVQPARAVRMQWRAAA